jgi:signal transduction histidine kinase
MLLRHRSWPPRLLIAAAILITAAWGAAFTSIYRANEHAIDRDLAELLGMARLLASSTHHAVKNVDLLLRDLVEEIERLAEPERRSGPRLHELLVAKLATVRHARTGIVLDADGKPIGHSDTQAPPSSNRGDRTYFQVQRDDPKAGLFIGPPIRVNQAWAISLSRRLARADGGFDGVVAIALDPNVLTELIASIDPRFGLAVELVGTDGVIRAHYPADDAFLGTKLPAHMIERLSRNAQSLDGADPAVDTHRRDSQLAYASVRDYPLRVTVSRHASATLAASRPDAWLAVIAAVLATALILILLEGVRRDWARKEQHALALAAAISRAEIAERGRRRILGVVSNEFNTPINAIMVFAELLKKGYVDSQPKKRLEYANHIAATGQQLAEKVEEVLDQARLEAGELKLEPETVEPKRLIDAVARLVEGEARSTGIQLELPGQPTPFALHVDARRLKQIFINLLLNAVRTSRRDGVVAIEINALDDGAEIVLVQTGGGMSEAQLGQALDPNPAQDGTQQSLRDGVWRGLWMVRNLVELHDGTMSVHSAPGAGTTVKLLFPAERVLPAQSARPTALAAG